ncbi:hypothetical protein ZOSMA_346G00050 [Zostera marina]|uniref:Uncharacterized protein n=1 Tax=Zostera marina TaxID=29655 RepID=A0A0K9P7A5_ZOSMR|nr:hypothetical protein ZOSMA_346G00050 [Zostera marina]
MVVTTPDRSDDHSTDEQDYDHPNLHEMNMAGDQTKKKSREQNKDHPEYHPSQGQRFVIKFRNDQIVHDSVAKKLNKKCAMVANDFKLLPMDVPWFEQDQKNIDEAMETIQREFDYSGSTFGYRRVNERLNKLWRSAYNSLLDKYNNKDLTVEEVIRTLPDYIIKDQFLKKLMKRRSPRGLEISEINKGNRAKQTSHSLGSKSLAQRNYEANKRD